MRIFKYLGFFLVLLSIASCNVEEFEEGILTAPVSEMFPEPTGTASFSVTIDGESFIADAPVATVIDNAINITGIRTSTGEVVTITVIGNAPGTYQLGVTQNQVEVNSASYVTSLDGSGQTWIAATDFVTPQGEVVITEIDQDNQTLSGTFSFVGTNPDPEVPTVALTNGVFSNVSFGAGLVTGDASNMFSANVDGVAFNQESVNATLLELAGLSNISIVATKSNMETIGITVESNIVPGDYELGGFSPPLAQYNVSFTNSNLGEGTLTVTQHDTANRRIAGTFSFSATSILPGDNPVFEITEGSFDVSY